jgi:predicted nuclease of restriction endonuclease-like RecB superfamily
VSKTKRFSKRYSEQSPYTVKISPENAHFTSRDTKVKNQEEEAVKMALLDSGINSYYEYGEFALPKNHAYLPDFITELRVNGKQVILEPHGNVTGKYLAKLNDFRNIYGFYVVIFLTRDPKRNISNGVNPKNYVDEFWSMPNLTNRNGDFKVATDIIKEKINFLIEKGKKSEEAECARLLRKKPS